MTTSVPVLLVFIFGKKRAYVRATDYDSGRALLAQCNDDGSIKGRTNYRARTWTAATPLHRENITFSPDSGFYARQQGQP